MCIRDRADAVRGQNTGKLVQKPEQPAEEQTEVTEQLLFAGQGMRCRYGWGYKTCTVRLLQSVLGKTPDVYKRQDESRTENCRCDCAEIWAADSRVRSRAEIWATDRRVRSRAGKFEPAG